MDRRITAMKYERKGFTLVELLIVIVVIGILSAMMMLSSTEAVSSAKVNNIINNLRNFKTATLSWYTDNLDKVNANGKVKKPDGSGYAMFGKDNSVTIAEIAKYLNTELKSDGSDNSGGKYMPDYTPVDGGSTTEGPFRWFIVYKLPNSDTRIKEKLEAHAASIGLMRSQPGTGNRGEYSATAEGSDYVAIEVINFSK